MSESQPSPPLAYNDSRVATAAGWVITAGVGAGSGWVGGAASEAFAYPKQVAVRNDLDMRINVKNIGVETIQTELARRELGYTPQLNGSTDELQAAETRLHIQVAELRHEKQPLDDAHDSYVTTAVLVGAGLALAFRAGPRAYRNLFPRTASARKA
jgi:hypothetical protein